MSKSKSPQGPSDKQEDNKPLPEELGREDSPEAQAQDATAPGQPAESDEVAGESEAAIEPSAEPRANITGDVAPSDPAVTEKEAASASASRNEVAQSPQDKAAGTGAASASTGGSATPPPAAGKSTSGSGSGSGSGRTVAISAVVAILVSAGMVGAAGYYGFHRQEQTQEQLQSQLAALSETNQQQQRAIAEMERTVQQQRSQLQQSVDSQLTQTRQQLQQQVQSQVQQQDSAINRLQERVDAHQERLLSLSTTSREDWLLAEAEYLLKLANQRVLLERLPSNAIALLEAADLIIRQVAGGMGDAELFAVRRALADELAALKRIDPVDKEGIYLKLNSLAGMVDDLPRVPGHSFGEPAQQAQTEEQDQPQTSDPEAGGLARLESWVLQAWDEVKGMAGMLDDYIKIEDAEAPAKPLVDQYTSQVAGLNVRLLLEQAQVALLKEQPMAYQQSLEQAQALIDKYYIDSAPARELRQSLEQLASVEIAPELPDISESLKILNGYIRQLHKLQPAAEGQL